ncbi:guanylate kinase [Pelagibacteraceae bacterium]|nr:guanylate kinase [Pelagibacteraceae bacterium]
MNTEKINKLIIISSPSGAGKTTLCKLLIKKMKNINLSISYTSRNKRLNEVEGKDYFFVNKDKFKNLKKQNFFIETAKNFNNFYGSPFKNINKAFKRNQHILFDIDWKGARKIRSNYNKNNIIDFFILPPSKIELKRRLVKRGRDNNKEINLRLSYAIDEMKHYKEYKYVLINENIQKTVDDIKKIIEYNILMENRNKILKSRLKRIINI